MMFMSLAYSLVWMKRLYGLFSLITGSVKKNHEINLPSKSNDLVDNIVNPISNRVFLASLKIL